MKFDALIQKLENEGLDPRSYSGRFMYGKECVAASVDYPGQYNLPKGYKIDTLGRGYIVYWPNVKWEDKE